MISPILERCDHDGLPAYLESSKEKNIPFYRRHGFEVLDLAVYLHADEEFLIAWYSERFVRECALAREDAGSFYRGWSQLPEPEQRALAVQFWSEINHPNLVDHIEPTAARADAVVVKRADHTLDRVEWRR